MVDFKFESVSSFSKVELCGSSLNVWTATVDFGTKSSVSVWISAWHLLSGSFLKILLQWNHLID